VKEKDVGIRKAAYSEALPALLEGKGDSGDMAQKGI